MVKRDRLATAFSGVPPRAEKAEILMYTVYILKNQKGRHYVGYTGNFENRIKKHNAGGSKYTKGKGQWHLVYREEFITKGGAFRRERQIKRYKGGKAFKALVTVKKG